MGKYLVSFTFLLLVFLQDQTVSASGPVRLPDSTKYFPCATQEPTIVLHRLELNGCRQNKQNPRCKLIKGTTGNLEIDFTSPVDLPKFTIQIQGILSGIPVPWAIPGGNDACAHISPKSDGECVKAGVRQTFSMSLPILSTYPSVSVVISLKLIDEGGNARVCMKIPSVVAPAP